MKAWIVIRSDENGCLRPGFMPFQHFTRQDAVTEAERLSRTNPGKIFAVFEAVSMSVYKPVITVSL